MLRRSRSHLPLAVAISLAALGGCKRGEGNGAAASASASADPPPPDVGTSVSDAPPVVHEFTPPDGPALGAIAGQANIMAEPSATSKRLGYLRLGAIVGREPEPAGKAGCPGGWYRVKPRGFVCTGDEATIDMKHPVLRAASRMKPDRASALPYHYGFVRAVLPLYLKAPNAEEQTKAEFKLKEHLAKWESSKDELNKVVLGSYDVPVDARGVPIASKKVGEVARPSTSWGQGELFGGLGEGDPVPWWLEGGSRKIPNVADFKVPEYATFADRARRHTGLAFIGSFQLGPEAFNRRFGITTDLRLAPISKVKPDTGSPWHGIELGDAAKSPPLPFAWVRVSDAKTYKLVDGKAKEKSPLEKRSIVLLTGKKVPGPDDFYWELKNGQYIRAAHASVVMTPTELPEAAKKGQKWIDVSIENQTLVLYKGEQPVYATMVSTGQDKMGDPKTSKSTVRGTFQIRSKHVTATMDSNEGSSAGGKRAGGGASARRSSSDDDAPARKDPGKSDKKKDKGDAPKKDKGGDKGDDGKKRDRDPEYGVTKRRGEGTFWLRDVPYVQYFESGYALHVAYWHDVFGIARSHGCINLSPIDGKYVFGWTDPQPPEGWHGVITGAEMGEGTTIVIHE